MTHTGNTTYPKIAQAGFVLIELLVVISIIGTLSSVVYSTLEGGKAKARDAVRVSWADQVGKAMTLYELDNGRYPGQPEDVSGDAQTFNLHPNCSSDILDELRASGYLKDVQVDPRASQEQNCSELSQEDYYFSWSPAQNGLMNCIGINNIETSYGADVLKARFAEVEGVPKVIFCQDSDANCSGIRAGDFNYCFDKHVMHSDGGGGFILPGSGGSSGIGGVGGAGSGVSSGDAGLPTPPLGRDMLDVSISQLVSSHGTVLMSDKNTYTDTFDNGHTPVVAPHFGISPDFPVDMSIAVVSQAILNSGDVVLEEKLFRISRVQENLGKINTDAQNNLNALVADIVPDIDTDGDGWLTGKELLPVLRNQVEVLGGVCSRYTPDTQTYAQCQNHLIFNQDLIIEIEQQTGPFRDVNIVTTDGYVDALQIQMLASFEPLIRDIWDIFDQDGDDIILAEDIKRVAEGGIVSGEVLLRGLATIEVLTNKPEYIVLAPQPISPTCPYNDNPESGPLKLKMNFMQEPDKFWGLFGVNEPYGDVIKPDPNDNSVYNILGDEMVRVNTCSWSEYGLHYSKPGAGSGNLVDNIFFISNGDFRTGSVSVGFAREESSPAYKYYYNAEGTAAWLLTLDSVFDGVSYAGWGRARVFYVKSEGDTPLGVYTALYRRGTSANDFYYMQHVRNADGSLNQIMVSEAE